jgi:glycerol kinase
MSRPLAAAIDLGSTGIKSALLHDDGELHALRRVAAPPLTGSGGRREGDADHYLELADALLAKTLEGQPSGLPLGVATQRSSFTIWDRQSGKTRLPLISWQDRRAAAWCDSHRPIEAEVTQRTGLPLSAHYAGPKLASLRDDSFTAAALQTAGALFGTLESRLLWRWSEGRVHETDLSVAARTLMVDLQQGDWSSHLLDQFEVPRALLPTIAATRGRHIKTPHGARLDTTISDQAAAALPVLDPAHPTMLINLGTGAFVLRTAAADERVAGYLLAPLLRDPGGTRYCLEGTVNGAGPAVDHFSQELIGWAGGERYPEAFALPDRAGLGSPFWRPDLGLELSDAARGLPEVTQRRVVMEGLLFRLRGIVEELGNTERVVVSGGLTRDPAVVPGLAAVLGRPVELLEIEDSGLVGCARLAAGLPAYAAPRTRSVEPSPDAAYLGEKYAHWRAWLDTLLLR